MCYHCTTVALAIPIPNLTHIYGNQGNTNRNNTKKQKYGRYMHDFLPSSKSQRLDEQKHSRSVSILHWFQRWPKGGKNCIYQSNSGMLSG